MMRLLIPIALLVLGLGGGVGAGMFLAGPAPEADASGTGADAAAATPEGAAEVTEDAAPASPPPVEQTGAGTEYVRLNNQFVVPIVRDGTVRSLVVLGLTIEVVTGQNSTVFAQEPRLRDSFLRVMFAHANAGGFDGSFTEATAMAPLREALREAAVQVLGGSITHDVLITDITRQDA